MAKRFTDTAKWKKEFIKGLSAKHKLLWFYILDDCDHAGIWEVDFEVASLRIGEDLTYEEAFVALGCQFEVIGKNRWWIRDFISFQYGTLTEKNKMYKPVMDTLKKFNINYPPSMPHNMEHISPIDGVIDIDKDKDKVKVKVEYKKESQNTFDSTIVFREENPLPKAQVLEALFLDEIYIEELRMTHRGKDIKKAFEECWIHHSSGEDPPKSVEKWKQKLNTWLINTKNGTGKAGQQQATNARREGFAKRHSSDTGG